MTKRKGGAVYTVGESSDDRSGLQTNICTPDLSQPSLPSVPSVPVFS
jgi:hypothetical protein